MLSLCEAHISKACSKSLKLAQVFQFYSAHTVEPDTALHFDIVVFASFDVEAALACEPI
jgi:hypothetical protein